MASASTKQSRKISEPVGKQVRELRKSRGQTLAGLAKATGRSVGNLSELERGVRPISLDTLDLVARALDVSISWFFSGPAIQDVADADLVVRQANRREINLSKAGVREELLSPSLNNSLEMVLTTFRPGSSNGEEGRQRRGDEGGLVLSGTLELRIDGRMVLLEAGDSFQLSGTGTHWCRNTGETDTVVVWSFSVGKF